MKFGKKLAREAQGCPSTWKWLDYKKLKKWIKSAAATKAATKVGFEAALFEKEIQEILLRELTKLASFFSLKEQELRYRTQAGCGCYEGLVLAGKCW